MRGEVALTSASGSHLRMDVREAVAFEIRDSQVTQHRTAAAPLDLSELRGQLAGRGGGCRDHICLRAIRAVLGRRKLGDHLRTELRAVDVHDCRRFLPTLQTVDVARTDRARTEASGDAVLRVEPEVRSGFRA